MTLGFRKLFRLADMQARMGLKAEASKLVLSYLWWIIEPAMFIAVFYFVFEVLMRTGRGDFLLFLLCGKIPFVWFSKTVTLASASISGNRKLVGQMDIPKVFFPMASIQQSLYKEGVVILLALGVAIGLGATPTLMWLWLIPLALVQYLLIAVASFVGAICVARVEDARIVITLMMTFLLFVSGIFWDVARIPNPAVREGVLIANPLAFLIDAYRQIIMHNRMFDGTHLAILGGLLAIALVVVFAVMQKKSRTIAGWVVNA